MLNVDKPRAGKVYLVGAGPGDPELLTLKAYNLIAAADCILYDYLVNPEILSHAASSAELIDVGKRGTEYGWTQDEINRLLIEKGRQHQLVVRLKGGDPFIFGRGGEEATALVEAGIEWEMVPGVSAGASVPAYAGIPVTHRGVSSSVAFVTGHEQPGKERSSIRWEHLATGVDTLVFFMGVSRVREISSKLIANGRNPETPVAIIEWGTYEHQHVLVGGLSEIAVIAERERIGPPAIIVVGEVVRLRENLQWFAPLALEAAMSAA